MHWQLFSLMHFNSVQAHDYTVAIVVS
uniref:Uncharacterized protein n=1 Tax=Arundo donax TaxID=35708 RepID=A0A0A9BBG9_ARUDO